MNSNQRSDMRKVFFDCFQKHQSNIPLSPVEKELIDIILLHPEYHSYLCNPDHIDDDHAADQNPFLHISLHLALREQISTNRPAGIRDIYVALCKKLDDVHTAEHRMIDHLANALWKTKEPGIMPDENEYLMQLRELV